MKNEVMEIGKRLNESVSIALAQSKIGFERAYVLADSIGKLENLLTPEYMKPIMNLQNNRLGFRTDKPDGSGYSEIVVKRCLIEAVLTGVQPTGNQFNIIAGNCYITKEGFGYLLKNQQGLNYEIVPGIPESSGEKGAIIPMTIVWSLNGGEKETRVIKFPIRVNSMMGADGIIGKATRKARAWLYNNLNETEVADGEIEDGKAEVISSKKIDSPDDEAVTLEWIAKADSLETLEMIEASAPDMAPETRAALDAKKALLKNKTEKK